MAGTWSSRISSALRWLEQLQNVIKYGWTLWTLAITGGAVMYALAAATAWLRPWGPIVWGMIGLATCLISAIVFLLCGLARMKFDRAMLFRDWAKRSSVNVLAKWHEREVIRISDFYDPGFISTDDVTFEHCRLLGPGMLLIQNCTFYRGTFQNCEIAVTRTQPVGMIFFQRCKIEDCLVRGVTFVMTKQDYNNLPQEMRSNLKVITDTQGL